MYIPVQVFADIWETLMTYNLKYWSFSCLQVIETLAINIFFFEVSFIIWIILENTIGIRISEEAEKEGTDKVEVSVKAYMIRDWL